MHNYVRSRRKIEYIMTTLRIILLFVILTAFSLLSSSTGSSNFVFVLVPIEGMHKAESYDCPKLAGSLINSYPELLPEERQSHPPRKYSLTKIKG